MNLEVKPTRCRCHPETCGCNSWSVYQDGKKLISFFHEEDAKIHMLSMQIDLNSKIISELQS
jgi:hypothetical protein